MTSPENLQSLDPASGADEGIVQVSIVEQLTNRLREKILRGDWKAGEQLRQENIAEMYRVSRMPVREALRQLEMEGLVVFRTHRGAEVTALSTDDLDELLDLRTQIETDLISQAVAKSGPSDVAKIEQALLALDQAFVDGDHDLASRCIWTFFETLYQPAQRPHTLRVVKVIYHNIDRYVRLYLTMGQESVERAWFEYQDILNAYKAADRSSARTLMRSHLSRVKRDLKAYLRSQSDEKT